MRTYTHKQHHKVMMEGAQSPKSTIKSEHEILRLTRCDARLTVASTEANGKFSMTLVHAGCWPILL